MNKIATTILNKRARASYWSEPEHDFTPAAGELIVYLPDDSSSSVVKIKVGNGTTLLSDLQYLNVSDVDGYTDGVILLDLSLREDGTIFFEGSHAELLDASSQNEGGMSSDNSAGAGSSTTVSIPYISVDKNGHVTKIEDKKLTINIPNEITDYLNSTDKQELQQAIQTLTSNVYTKEKTNELIQQVENSFPESIKNPNALTIGDVTYDGSIPINVSAETLGLSSAMKFIGVTSTEMSDGLTSNTITLNGGKSHTAAIGHVVLDTDSVEYVWDGVCWQKLGDAESYKKIQTPFDSSVISPNGNSDNFVTDIQQNSQGVITVVKKSVPVWAEGETYGGAAKSATKLSNERTISIKGATTTSVNFDGSADVLIDIPNISSDSIVAGNSVLIFDCGSATKNI